MDNTTNKYVKMIKTVMPALLIFICYFISVKYGCMAYLTNDDTSIQNALAGNTTGQPYPVHQFINVLLGFPLALFYRVFPSVQWWYVWSHLLIIIGMLLINYSIFAVAEKNNFPYIMALGLVILTDITFAFYSISNVSYTIVPGILGAGIVANFFLINDENGKYILIFGIIGFIISSIHRYRTGQVILCYILLVVLYFFVKKSSWKKAFLSLGVVAFFMICMLNGIQKVSSAYQQNINGAEFLAYNSARVDYMDYPHDTFEENPEIYENVGWDYDTYLLTNSWCFLDENVTAESFSYLSESSMVQDKESPQISLGDFIEALKDPLVRVSIVIWLVSVGGCLISIIYGFNEKNFLFFLMNLGGTLVLIAYQLYIGRIFYRTLVIVLLPGFIINIMLMLISSRYIKNRTLMVCIFTVFIGVNLLCSKQIVEYTFDEERVSTIDESIRKDKLLKNYAIENRDNIYIKQTTGITLDISPYEIYLKDKPSNIISWGGSTFYSDIFYRSLERNGIEVLNGAVFKQDNVYLLSSFDAIEKGEFVKYDLFCIFYNWLKNNYEAVGFIKEETVCEGVYVYKFVFEDNVEQFEYYYDYVDGKLLQRDSGK